MLLRALPLFLLPVFNVAGDGGGGGGGAPAPAPAGGTPPTPPAPAPGEEFKGMTREQFNGRMADQEGKGKKAVLDSLGFKDEGEAKAFLDAARKKADAEKTELQRAQDQAKEFAPKAARADALEKSIKAYLEAEEKAIPEAQRGLLDLAPPADQVEARLDWITKAKAKGMFTAAAPAGDPKKAANTRVPGAPPVPGGNQEKAPADMTPEERRAKEKQFFANLPRDGS